MRAVEAFSLHLFCEDVSGVPRVSNCIFYSFSIYVVAVVAAMTWLRTKPEVIINYKRWASPAMSSAAILLTSSLAALENEVLQSVA